MPNPNRPQYQDTIEETWGQAVADTVVRRYTSSADRDADLAGFTPAQLTGQVVAIAPGAGALPYLMQHNGAAWVLTVAPIQAGSSVVVTNSGGAVNIFPPRAQRAGDFMTPVAIPVGAQNGGFWMGANDQPNYFQIITPAYPNSSLRVNWSLPPYV
jgi:hypothetical protein